jgi:replicative DNA helicase
MSEQTTDVDIVEDLNGPEDAWWERAVIGSVLQGYNDLPRLKRLITRDDFANPIHGGLWHLIVSLDADGEVPTVAAVVQRLGGHAQRMPGGPVYLSDMLGSSEIHPFQAEMYAQELRKCSLLRQGGQLGLRLVQMVREPGSDPDVMLARNQEWLDRIRERRESIEVKPSALDAVVDIARNGNARVPTTAWSDFDNLFRGWTPGGLTIVAGRPGAGKTLFAENAVTDMIRRHRLHALFVSLEMTEEEITQRTLAQTAGVNLSSIITGGEALTPKDWVRLDRAMPKLQADRDYLTVADAGGQTILDIKAAIVAADRRARRVDNRLGIVAVDYVGLVRATNPRLSRQQHIGEVVNELKALAKQYRTHLLVLAQLNRNPEGRQDKRPQVSDLRESGDLEQTADNVWLLHEEEIDDNGQMVKTGDIDAILGKQRNGPTGVRSLIKFGEYARLSQPERQLRPTPPSHLSVVKD